MVVLLSQKQTMLYQNTAVVYFGRLAQETSHPFVYCMTIETFIDALFVLVLLGLVFNALL